MNNSEVVFFIHGGPGFNSVAESEILSPLLRSKNKRVVFWNEPSFEGVESPSKSNNAFNYWCESLISSLDELGEENIHLIAHSFAVQPVLHLHAELKNRISRLTIISPVTNLNQAYRNILKIAENDFTISSPEKALLLSELHQKNKKFYDEAIQKGLALAAEDPTLFLNYWCNKEVMNHFFEIWSQAQVGLKMDSFEKVISSMERFSLPEVPEAILITTKIAYGEKDPVATYLDQNEPTSTIFKNSVSRVFKNSGHFTHLEEAQEFLDWALAE